MKSAALIYNPNSGKGKSTARAEDFSAAWKKRFGTDVLLRQTTSYEDIRVAARETAGDDVVSVFLGGDGTLSECVQGLAEASEFKPLTNPLGFLPGGSGNSFLRDFGVLDYETARDELFNAVDAGVSIPIDSGMIRYKAFDPTSPETPGADSTRLTVNIWGLGLVPDIAALAIRMRYLGELNYTVASIIKMCGHKPFPVDVVIDGDKHQFNCNLICLSNSRFTGGAMEIAPDVRVNDGKLFFTASEIQNRLALFGLFPSIFKGKHLSDERMTCRMVENVEFESDKPFFWNVDGELDYGFSPKVSIEPAFFKLLLPPTRLLE